MIVIDKEKSLQSASIMATLEDDPKIKVYRALPYSGDVNGQIEPFRSTWCGTQACLKADGQKEHSKNCWNKQ